MKELEKTLCREVKYWGLYDMKGLLSYNIKREWSLQRNNVKYDIDITTALNPKTVIVKLSKQETFKRVFELVGEILKYECLFDGRFFKLSKIEIDGLDKSTVVDDYMLAYYSGTKSYSILIQHMNDTTYKRGFCAWEIYNKRSLNINQMFYYIGFSGGIMIDLRLALFSELFEPLSEMLVRDNKLQIINSKPIIEKKAKCPACGKNYKIPIHNAPSFSNRIECVINGYRNDIFTGNDIDVILRKTVNTRNKMLYVDVDKKDVMNGGQSGFYIRMFVDLYYIIVLNEIKLWNADMEKTAGIKRFLK